MTPEQLKASILQYAIQGKLVEQRPEEGTGEELYRQIQTEKQRLIKEGKIKKEKPLPEIADDEIPFDIPESWKWVRIPEIGTSSLGKTLNKATDVGDEVTYLCSINVYWDGINLNQVKTAKFSVTDMEKYLLHRGDLLVCEGGDIGRSAVWDSDMEMYFQNALHCIRFFGAINPYYFKYCFELYKGNKILENASKGMTIKHLVQGSLYSIPFPLPPLAEQHRIVAKIEELLPLVDRYAASYEKLEQFNTEFPEDMKKSILQYAIQGKLVEQRPEEGTGEELYKQIQAEKQQLIKEGKIKKEKPLPEIAEDEIPFDVPDSWKWVRLGSIIELQSGQDLTPENYNASKSGIPYITGASNIERGKVVINRWTESGRSFAYKNDLLLTCKGTVGAMAILLEPIVHIARQIMAVRSIGGTDILYIKLVLETLVTNLQSVAKSMIPGISRSDVLCSFFPLPPLAEQKRIVAKVEELLPLCERLK